jgi:hypothetical protein
MRRMNAWLAVASTTLLVVAASACTTEVDGDGPDQSVAPQIATSTVISRAEEWVDAKLHYCQAAYDKLDGDNACWAWEGRAHLCDRESNAAWNAYRSDCSGFVTFAWGLPAVGDGGYVTGDFAPFDNSFSHVITPDDLEPGDALNKVTNEHIVLFEEWIVKGQSAKFFEEPGCSADPAYAHEFSSNISISGGDVVIDYEGSTPFTPIRFDGIQAASTAPPVRTVIGANADGRLEMFYIDTDHAIRHIYQAEAGSSTWTGPIALGGDAKSLALGVNADGRLEIFYVGTNDHIYHNWQTKPNGGWHGEAAFGGAAKQIAVGTDADGHLEVIYIGTNDALYHNYETKAGPWSGEESLGGEAKQIATGNDADGAIELFYIGTDEGLYHNYQHGANGGWNGQAFLGGKALSIAAQRNSDGRVALVYIGTNSALYDNVQNAPDAGWAGQASLGH